MADNILVTPGVGVPVATDEIGAVHYQIVKLAYGALDAFTLVSPANPYPVTGAVTANLGTIAGVATEATLAARIPVNGQALMAASVPVVIASNQSAVPVSGTVTANAGTGVADVTASGTLGAINATVALALGGGYSGAVVQITGTWVGTIQFEGTVDGTNWLPINGVFAGTSAPAPTVTANGIIRLTPGGLAQFRVNMTAFTSGSAVITLRASQGAGGTFLNQSLTVGSNVIGKVGIDQTTPGTTNLVALAANQSVNVAQMNGVAVTMGSGVTGVGVQRVVLATDVALPPAAAASPTYAAAIVGLVPAALATDVFTITGSATKTVRVTRILVSGVQTTASQVNVTVIKRSTANTAGTSTAQTRVSYDSTNAAATATVLAYTANPTLGTTVGQIRTRRLFVPGAATASDAQGLEIMAGDSGQQMLTARGIAEVIAINLNAATLTGGSLNITIEWTES